MDYRKINSHIILLLIVFVVGLTTAMIGRLVILDKGADTGTANLAFVIILGVCIIVYLIILATLAHAVIPWIMRKLPNKKKSATKQHYRSNLPEDSQLQSKIESFCQYSDQILSGYISKEDMGLLHIYINQYAQNNMGGIPHKIKTAGLDKFELYHYGWNIWNHFDSTEQEETADRYKARLFLIKLIRRNRFLVRLTFN